MREIGSRLFKAAFEAGPNAAQRQSAINSNMTELRVEIEADDLASGLLRWELMRLRDGCAPSAEHGAQSAIIDGANVPIKVFVHFEVQMLSVPGL